MGFIVITRGVSCYSNCYTEMSIATVTVHSFINLFIDVSGYGGSPWLSQDSPGLWWGVPTGERTEQQLHHQPAHNSQPLVSAPCVEGSQPHQEDLPTHPASHLGWLAEENTFWCVGGKLLVLDFIWLFGALPGMITMMLMMPVVWVHLFFFESLWYNGKVVMMVMVSVALVHVSFHECSIDWKFFM